MHLESLSLQKKTPATKKLRKAVDAKMLLLWSVLICLGLSPGIIVANPDAKRLYDDLLSNYNRLKLLIYTFLLTN